MEEREMAKKNMILKVITGSRLYGTDTPESDMDYQAVFIPDKPYVMGLKKCEQVEFHEKENPTKIVDFTSYSLIKYIKLARENNPNIISFLYTPSNYVLFSNDYGKELIKNRHLFLSKKSYHTYRGYAHQMKHKMLIKNPTEGKRKELVDKYGFDTKFALHLIRLYYECLDIMTSGTIVYPSPHRRVLMKIRNGEWDIDSVLTESIRLEGLIDEAYARSQLQWAANDVEIEKLQISLLEQFWAENPQI